MNFPLLSDGRGGTYRMPSARANFLVDEIKLSVDEKSALWNNPLFPVIMILLEKLHKLEERVDDIAEGRKY